MKLGEALVKESLITREQLKAALERQVIFGGRLGTNFVELGILKERDLLSFLSRHFKVPAVDTAQLSAVDAETTACLSRELAEKYKAVPFRKDRNRLHVAMLDPRVMTNIDALRFITGYDIFPYAITELRLLHAMEKYYGTERDLRYISTFGQEEVGKPTAKENKEQILKIKEEFCNAREKEEIVAILLNESKKIASRAAIFIVKGDKMVGWKSRGVSADNREIALAPHSIFADVLSRRDYYRGPLLRIPENQHLVELLGGVPHDCLLAPIRIREKIIAILYVDNGNTSVLDASLNYVNTLTMMASLSFEIVVLRKKIREL